MTRRVEKIIWAEDFPNDQPNEFDDLLDRFMNELNEGDKGEENE